MISHVRGNGSSIKRQGKVKLFHMFYEGLVYLGSLLIIKKRLPSITDDTQPSFIISDTKAVYTGK